MLESVRQLSDEDVVVGLTRCVHEDRQVTARLLVHLAEVDARGLFRDRGFPSMFDYAVRKLNMSESEAGLRISVARLGRRFPIALELLSRGELHLTALRILAPVLDEDNIGLLQEARFKSKKEVLELLVRHAPQPDVPARIRRLPEPARARTLESRTPDLVLWVTESPRPADAAPDASLDVESETSAAGRAAWTPIAVAPVRELGRPAPMAAVDPLSPGRYRLTFTMSRRVRDKLEEAQALLRHQFPDGDVEQVFERALDLLIAQRKRQRFGHAAKPRMQPADGGKRDSRYIPRELRRQVSARCGEQCCFVAPDGTRCEVRGSLEFHHCDPFARGGPTSADNLALMCRAHNALLAERDYGRELILQRVASARVRASSERPGVSPHDPAFGGRHSKQSHM